MSAYEQAVIGAMMLDENAYWRVADIVRAEDFTVRVNAEIFQAIADLCKAGKPSDPVTMGEILPEHSVYMLDVCSNCSTTSARHYAEEVRKSGELRRVNIAGQKIAAAHCSYTDAQRILADVSPRDVAAMKPIKAYMADALAVMQKRCDSEESITGLPTGLGGIDVKTSGLQPGTLVIVAARPSMGKTAFALQIAVRTALRGKRVAMFALEMTGVQLSERAVSLISGVNYSRIRAPKSLDEADWPRITEAFSKLEKSALVVDESGTQTAESICARTRQMHMQEPLAMVVVDHLGLIDLPGKGNSVNETGGVTKAFKALSKDLGIPVVLLVQLNRKCEEGVEKRPLLSHLRESGRIEEDADIVMMLYRDDYYNEKSKDRGFVEVLIRKNRDGENGMVPLRANLAAMRFESCEGLPGESSESSADAIDFGSYASRKTAGGG